MFAEIEPLEAPESRPSNRPFSAVVAAGDAVFAAAVFDGAAEKAKNAAELLLLQIVFR